MAKRKKKKPAAQKEHINAADVVAIYDELDQLREQYPEAAAQVNPKYNKKTFLERMLGVYVSIRERFHIETPVNRKVYLWLHLLGLFGIHHFYAKHWIKGLLYLATCWTGISAGMTFLDWLAAFPKKPDENGCILV